MIEHVTKWANGDIAQGKIMLIAGVLALLAAIFAWKNGGEMLRGMLIPMGLIVLICGGYGGFMQNQRAGIITEVSKGFQEDAKVIRDAEIARISKECRTYKMMNYIWASMALVGVVILFMAGTNVWKGASLGIILLAATGFIVDNFLHGRAEVYLSELLRL
ncbi:MAG: hypothetical protein HKO93_01805 [Flavobacteriales bacterium]|nr:hypothetical protein [Flavobacteriales bacterium]